LGKWAKMGKDKLYTIILDNRGDNHGFLIAKQIKETGDKIKYIPLTLQESLDEGEKIINTFLGKKEIIDSSTTPKDSGVFVFSKQLKEQITTLNKIIQESPKLQQEKIQTEITEPDVSSASQPQKQKNQ